MKLSKSLLSLSVPQGPLGQDEEDLSLGEFPAQDRDVANIEPLPMQTLDRPSLLDSDENNNDSQRSSSISEVANQVTFHPIGSPRNSSDRFRIQPLSF
jgi:hypothetical protein